MRTNYLKKLSILIAISLVSSFLLSFSSHAFVPSDKKDISKLEEEKQLIEERQAARLLEVKLSQDKNKINLLKEKSRLNSKPKIKISKS